MHIFGNRLSAIIIQHFFILVGLKKDLGSVWQVLESTKNFAQFN